MTVQRRRSWNCLGTGRCRNIDSSTCRVVRMITNLPQVFAGRMRTRDAVLRRANWTLDEVISRACDSATNCLGTGRDDLVLYPDCEPSVTLVITVL